MKWTLFTVFVVIMSLGVEAQTKKIDQLEMLFSQGHYKRVFRKANRLLDKPEFDYSMMPKYYKSISLFQLIQNEYWFKRHPEALAEAEALFLEVKQSPDGEKIMNAHLYEISWLKNDLMTWTSDLKRQGFKDQFEAARKTIELVFGSYDDLELSGDVTEKTVKEDNLKSTEVASSVRESVVRTAKEQIGVPYVWAGNSPNGFDCSGFTSYVLGKHSATLSRRASDQYDQAKKIKRKQVQKGDLVFFDGGSGVSHVGIVISEKGEPIVMIHASSSKGVIVTEIDKSDYWKNRIHGYGTYFE